MGTDETERSGSGGETTEADSGDVDADQSSLLPETIHGRSLAGAILMAGLVVLLVTGERFGGPAGIAVAMLFPLYFLLGVYRPLRERIPFYDRWLGVPLFAYGLYLLATEWPSVLGAVFAALGGFTLFQMAQEWYVTTEVPDPE